MNLLVVGGGGREHAIIKKLRENPEVSTIYALPGNGGIAADAICVSEIGAKDIDKIVEFAKGHAIDFAVVAPDDPLALGCVDRLHEVGIPCFGPDAKAALLMIDAAKRASAHKVIAVMPYFGWARQDRKDKPRVSIGAKLVANMLHAAGCDRVMTCDLHADQIQGFFDVPVDQIYASAVFLPYLKGLNLENLAIAAPDMGGAKRANAYARYLECPVIICHKSRERANVVGSITAIGDVAGKNVVIVDDMVDTAGTLAKAANVLKEMGARSVRACATHPVFSGPAYDRIAESALEEVIVSDTLPLSNDPAKDKSKITVLTMTDMFASIISKVYNYEEISSSFIN